MSNDSGVNAALTAIASHTYNPPHFYRNFSYVSAAIGFVTNRAGQFASLRASAGCRLSTGKDANLIELMLKLWHACHAFAAKPCKHVLSRCKYAYVRRRKHGTRTCACALRSASRLVIFAFCILHFSFCMLHSAHAQPDPMALSSPTAPTTPATTAPPTATTFDPAVESAQFAGPSGPQTIPNPFPTAVPAPVVNPTPQVSLRSVKLLPRPGSSGLQISGEKTPSGETVGVVNGGLNVIIQGLTVEGLPDYFGPIGDIDIEMDRAVIWGIDIANLGQAAQRADMPLEIYMEGNIVFRQGDRTVYADRMYFDVRREMGVILNAEVLTPLPQTGTDQYQGLVRLRAAAVRQLDRAHFIAQDALITTSRLEEPSYHLASDRIMFEDIQTPGFDPFTRLPSVNPITLEPEVDHQHLVESQNNFLYVGGTPIFYWPTIKTDLQKPTYYVDNIRIRNDSIFGFQTLLAIDAFQLFGLDRPQGVGWTLDLDYLSERGLGFGTEVDYDRPDSFLGVPGPAKGRGDLWFIDDNGLDNLGFGRRDIVPEEDFRGRAFWNHRQHLVGGLLDDWTVQAEVGWISDRTFLEQYYESEWDENKDQVTGVRLKHTENNQAISVEANAQINDFFTQTQWLPRVDHYWLGQPLLGNTLTWFEHSQAAYADIGLASTPTNSDLAAIHALFPWEFNTAGGPLDAAGERLVTRQEIDVPLEFAPVKVVPYALGELAHWGEDRTGGDLQRVFFQTGVRASVPFWAADPNIRDALFNLNGLAHKVVFDGEVSFAQANRDMDQLPLYDELDDDSIEELRRRLFFPPFAAGLAPYYIFGAPTFIDPKFDPRFYALRSGIQGSVTSPTTEIADDLTTVRLGMRHRLQTKRGPLGAQHIVDWITFDTNATWFPRDNRDNFGSDIGLVDYDLRWHLGDRFTVLSDGAADLFGDALQTVSIGVLLNRPARGNAYVGFRTLNGPFEAHVLTTTLNYRMSPKWIGSASTSIDFGNGGNIGQSFAASRIGESLVGTVGFHVDESKDNVGVSLHVEPRFLPTLSVTRKTGIEVPPVDVYGVE
jgi:hypothetical protein